MASTRINEAKQERSRDLTMFLLKKGTDVDAIAKESECDVATCKVGRTNATLLYRQKPAEQVSWWKEIVDMTATGVPGLKSQSAGAVLVIPVKNHLFAITFGTGRYFIPDDRIVPRFGLKATLNAVDPERLRLLDHTRIDESSRNMREQVRVPGTTRTFAIDTAQDLLSGVSGIPSGDHETLGTWIAGRDSLTLHSVKVAAKNIPRLLGRLLDLESELTYRSYFAWVDNIRAIEDGETVRALEDQVLAILKNDSNDGTVGFCLPGIAEWEKIVGFKYAPGDSAPVYTDLVLRDFLATFRDLGKATASTLRGRRLTIEDSDGGKQSLSAWRCFFAEIPLNGDLHVLHDGKWYQVDKSFVKSVNEECADVPVVNFRLPPYDDKEERDYIARIGAEEPSRFTVFDGPANLIHYGGGSSSVEFCDLFDSENGKTRLIHIKRSNRSSGLSHLFAQASVSAEALISDDSFRLKVDKKLPAELRFGDRGVDPASCEIVLGVIERGNKERPNLPFFSRLNLRNNVRRLRRFGFKVSLLPIDDISPEKVTVAGEDGDD